MPHRFRRWLGVLLTLALAATAGAATPLPSVVLVHGAFADGSSWSRVIPRLQKRGYRVTAVQLPLTSLADDVAATRRVIDRQPGDVVLVGHSWGGVVVTEAGNAPTVKALVYLSALVPDSGESAQGLLQRLGAPMEGLAPEAAGLIWLDDPKAFQAVMAADLPLSTARTLAAVQKPLAARSFAEAVSHAAWRDKPTFIVISTKDQIIVPQLQKDQAKLANATAIEVPGSHVVMLSHPKQVADHILRAAK